MNHLTRPLSLGTAILLLASTALAKPQAPSQNPDAGVRLHAVAVISSTAQLENLQATLASQGLTEEDMEFIDKSKFSKEVAQFLEENGLKAESIQADLEKTSQAELVLAYTSNGTGEYNNPGNPYFETAPADWAQYYYDNSEVIQEANCYTVCENAPIIRVIPPQVVPIDPYFESGTIWVNPGYIGPRWVVPRHRHPRWVGPRWVAPRRVGPRWVGPRRRGVVGPRGGVVVRGPRGRAAVGPRGGAVVRGPRGGGVVRGPRGGGVVRGPRGGYGGRRGGGGGGRRR